MNSPKTSSNSKWVRYRSVAYLLGRGLTFGADDVFNPAANDLHKYSVNFDLVKTPVVDALDDNFQIIADGSLDHVFVGRHLESVDDLTGTLRELSRKLKVGGHLILHLPILAEAPFEHHQFTPEGVVNLVGTVGRWQAKDSYLRDGHLLQVYKKLPGKKGVIQQKARSGKPRACVCRYGALGDMVILTPLIRRLAEDGYEVTMNVTPYAAKLLEQNPFVHNIILQEREAIPNPDLGEYWAEWKGDYDRYINLSESIEGSLLRVEGRKDYFTSQAWRERTGNKNYYDHTMERGGYPEVKGVRGELFFSNAEERRAREFFEPLAGRFVILWAMNGSASHKAFPLFEPVAREWLADHPDTTIICCGDYAAKLLEFDHPQVICKCGEWTVREAAIATKYASLVVGPETFLLNAAACWDTPKIVFMSHSGADALCKYWTNCQALEPDRKIAPCFPCYQLHTGTATCPIGQMIDEPTGQIIAEGPMCIMNAITGPRVLEAINHVYSQRNS
jgi:ADP-heptose:LPS heptosyltransferase